MSDEPLQSITFGIDGDDAYYLGAGWSAAEPGFRWMVDSESEVWLENPGPGSDFVVEVELQPFCSPPYLESQRLALEVRGHVVGRSVMTSRQTIAYHIPSALVADKGPVRIVFQHQDAARPIDCGWEQDERVLAFSARSLNLFRVAGDISKFSLAGGHAMTVSEIEAQTGLSVKELVLQFESLGDNCEFGLVQRRCDAEPLGLLRFSNLQLPQLVRGVCNGFDGLGELRNVEFSLNPGVKREYAMLDKGFGLVFHTFLYEGEVNEKTLPRQQSNRLKFLRRKLLEDFTNGEKIFVYKRNQPLSDEEIFPLHDGLNQYARNTLLWVAGADAAHEPGSVEQIRPGLLKGYVDRLAPYDNAHDLSFEMWLSLCAKAWRMVRAAGGGQTEATSPEPAASSSSAAGSAAAEGGEPWQQCLAPENGNLSWS